MSDLGWTLPALALAALPAGAAVALLARRRLGRGRTAFAWTAAVARGAAVALALAAAAGPFTTSTAPVRGSVLLASATSSGAGVVRWPEDAPDARSALETARAIAPRDAATVGLELPPDAGRLQSLDTADALRRRVTPTYVLRPATSAPQRTDLAAPRLVAPSRPTEGVAFSLDIEADPATPAFDGSTAVLRIDGIDSPCPLTAGARRVAAPAVSLRAGRHVVSVDVPGRAPAAISLVVHPTPTVLVISALGDEPQAVRRLRTQGLRVSVVSDAQADLAGPADVVIAGPGAGVRCAGDLASRAAAGTGLLVAGGRGVQGLSRFRGTALEALLPVELPPPPAPEPPPPPKEDDPPPPQPGPEKPSIDEGEREALRVALVLVIDRSGSMAGLKLLMAREAAMAAARTLSTEDRVGVIAFDDEPQWIAPLQDAREMATLHRRLQSIEADGGTNIHPALKLAYGAILGERCGIRHIVLLSDGATSPGVWGEVIGPGTEQNVTLSTVAVGDGADADLLAKLALMGHGRLYPAVDPSNLPQVITLDTRRFVHEPRERRRAGDPAPPDVPKPPEPERPAEPARSAGAPMPPKADAPPRIPRVAFDATFLAGLTRTPWPPLVHAETVRSKSGASAPLVWDDDAPALVAGRVASGRCVVIAADVVSADGRDFWDWPESGPFLAQLVRALAPAPAADSSPGVRIGSLDGGAATVTVDAPGGGLLRVRPAGGGPEWSTVCRGSGDASLAVLPRRPNEGVHVGTFVPHDGGEGAAVVTAIASDAPASASARATELVLRSGAPLVDARPDPPDAPPRRERKDASAALLVAAAALLVGEAAARRGVRG